MGGRRGREDSRGASEDYERRAQWLGQHGKSRVAISTALFTSISYICICVYVYICLYQHLYLYLYLYLCSYLSLYLLISMYLYSYRSVYLHICTSTFR